MPPEENKKDKEKEPRPFSYSRPRENPTFHEETRNENFRDFNVGKNIPGVQRQEDPRRNFGPIPPWATTNRFVLPPTTSSQYGAHLYRK